ncbi:MAG TPA: hypothetical protein DCL44_00980 [Elusimicrobia bacterium]|nr:hypothetical protein [Elusimicrobiota bacterium]
MKIKHVKKHSVIWRKAAVLGSLWAASEIVLGSFLHNARIPFSGEFLTAIGIVILVSGHRLWPERGLLWRAGLVCAAMKSVSPSAVIFGPMIAISMEGLLAEAGVRLLGGNTAGYLLGGGLAMIWALLQKIGTMLLFYGPDTVALYSRGLERLRSLAGLGPGNLYGPLLFLLGLYFIGGLVAAVMGISAKYVTAGQPTVTELEKINKRTSVAPAPGRKYSSWAFVFHALFLAAAMSAGRKFPPALLCLVAGCYAAGCAHFYPRAGTLLKRTGIWAGVLTVSLLAGLVLGSPVSGLYMALRAFVLTMGFAAIGEELLNPAIRSRLVRLFGPEFFDTLEQAFDTLPTVLNAMPGGAELARNPVKSLSNSITRMPGWLAALDGQKVFIITGGHGSGKSSLAADLAEALRVSGKKPGGILSVGLWKNGERKGFDVIDLVSGVKVPLCRKGGSGTGTSTGDFNFYGEGISAGLKALSSERLTHANVVFVDEVGFLELEGKGWAPALTQLRELKMPLIIVVRDYLLERITGLLTLDNPVVWEAGKTDINVALKELSGAIEAVEKNTPA